MKLLHSNTSPYARKVRIVAAEKKLELDLEVVDPWSSPADLARINPLGKVPALVMDDSTTLFDSRVIVEYLDGLSPVHRLIPEASRDRIAAKRWEAIADGLCDAAILARLEAGRPDKNESSSKQIERQRSKIAACLEEMARELGERGVLRWQRPVAGRYCCLLRTGLSQASLSGHWLGNNSSQSGPTLQEDRRPPFFQAN